MAEIAKHAGIAPWPSLESASWWFDRASWALIGSLIAGALSTALIVWMGTIKEEHWDLLRSATAEKVAILDNETAVAKKDTALAHERIAELNKETAKLSAEADASRALIAGANARAIEAQLALARFKAPRTIDPADRSKMVSDLRKLAGTKVAIYILGEGPEPNNLGQAIRSILVEANIDALAWNWSGAGSAVGVIIMCKPGSDAQLKNICDNLVAVLNAAHIDTIKQEWPGDWKEFGGMLNGPNPPAPTDAPVRIVVGTKPQ